MFSFLPYLSEGVDEWEESQGARGKAMEQREGRGVGDGREMSELEGRTQ